MYLNTNSNVIFIWIVILRYLFYEDFKCHLHKFRAALYVVIIIQVIFLKYHIYC